MMLLMLMVGASSRGIIIRFGLDFNSLVPGDGTVEVEVGWEFR